MKPASKRRAIDYLDPDLNAERVARMWNVIEARQGAASHAAGLRTRWVLAAAALAAAACLVLALRWPHKEAALASAAATGDVIVTSGKSTSLSLPDGSAVVLSEAAKLAVTNASPSDVSLHLERGRVTCDVTHREGRRFTVEAMGVTVQVKGTHFTVDISPINAAASAPLAAARVTVHVERGVVEVRDRAQALLATMTAGQSWSGAENVVAVPTPAVDAVLPPAASVVPTAVPPPSAAPTPALDADATFERANAARIAGRAAEAAAAYDRFRRTFPSDSRAGLAAFELGRIRLDSLHDPQRALGALRFALAHNRGGFAAEDAEALQIDALQRLGDQAGCAAARAAFLSAHPRSAHVARITRACPGG